MAADNARSAVFRKTRQLPYMPLGTGLIANGRPLVMLLLLNPRGPTPTVCACGVNDACAAKFSKGGNVGMCCCCRISTRDGIALRAVHPLRGNYRCCRGFKTQINAIDHISPAYCSELPPRPASCTVTTHHHHQCQDDYPRRENADYVVG